MSNIAEVKPKMKARGGNSPIKGDVIQVEPGDNAHYVIFNKSIMDLPDINIHDLGELENRIDEFFGMCASADMRPTVSGLAMSIGIDRRRLWEVANEKHSHSVVVNKLPVDCANAITKAYRLMELMWESLSINSRLNPMAIAFFGINHFQYQDVKNITIAPVVNDPLGDLLSEEELRKKYMSAIPEGDYE